MPALALPLALAFYLGQSSLPILSSVDQLLASVRADAHPTAVHFWATWCKTCVDELPEIRRLESSLRGSQIRLLLVSLDPKEKSAAVSDFLAQHALLPSSGVRAVLLDAPDASQVTSRFDPNWSAQLPATFLVVSSGSTVAAFLGPTPVDAVLESIHERFGPEGSTTGKGSPRPPRR